MRMERYVALLSGIPVGSKSVSPERLRLLLERLNLFEVEMLPGTGNVAFKVAVGILAPLEAQISRHLMKTLRNDITTFIRTPAELQEIVEHEPFPHEDQDGEDTTVFVVFMADEPDDKLQRQLRSLWSEADEFRVRGREIYWLKRPGKPSKVTGPLLQKTLGTPATVRSLEMIQKLVAEAMTGH
ncbi:MAG TPA: DUF1697 domain-containing protein [Gemmatimonadaceae bacterium]|nr:DUF1697 domain-containing protein [Gemmatimonadaceae bacterium]